MGCGCIIGSLACIAVLVAAGVCAWRFGPWYNASESDVASAPEDLAALNVCDGCCNLAKSNCDLKVNEVTFGMVHNAMSSKDNLFAGYNNLKSMEGALVAGYRGLMLDSCICDGSIGETVQGILKGDGDKGENYLGFCHTSCDAGVRDPAVVLGNVKTFLDVNPNEVLMIHFEVIDGSLEKLYSAIEDSGLNEYAYADRMDAWPTMQQLIDANKRLLIFAHGDGINESCTTSGSCPEGIYYKFDHFTQTNWNDETCDIKGNDPEVLDFFLMNHWKNSDADLPSQLNAEEFNTYDALLNRFKQCGDRIPNVIAVDFWSLGDVPEFVFDVNQKNLKDGTATADTADTAAEARSQEQELEGE